VANEHRRTIRSSGANPDARSRRSTLRFFGVHTFDFDWISDPSTNLHSLGTQQSEKGSDDEITMSSDATSIGQYTRSISHDRGLLAIVVGLSTYLNRSELTGPKFEWALESRYNTVCNCDASIYHKRRSRQYYRLRGLPYALQFMCVRAIQ